MSMMLIEEFVYVRLELIEKTHCASSTKKNMLVEHMSYFKDVVELNGLFPGQSDCSIENHCLEAI